MDKNPKIGIHCGSCFVRNHLEIPRAYAILEKSCPRLYQAAEDMQRALAVEGRVRPTADQQVWGEGLDQIFPSVLKEKQDRGGFRESARH